MAVDPRNSLAVPQEEWNTLSVREAEEAQEKKRQKERERERERERRVGRTWNTKETDGEHSDTQYPKSLQRSHVQ